MTRATRRDRFIAETGPAHAGAGYGARNEVGRDGADQLRRPAESVQALRWPLEGRRAEEKWTELRGRYSLCYLQARGVLYDSEPPAHHYDRGLGSPGGYDHHAEK